MSWPSPSRAEHFGKGQNGLLLGHLKNKSDRLLEMVYDNIHVSCIWVALPTNAFASSAWNAQNVL
jgi:hypothetical protein